MPRCCQFSEDRKEPSAGLMGCGVPISPQSRSATDKLGDTARAENWRNPGGKKGSHPFLGASSLGHLGRVRGPFPSRASLLSYSPLRGCSFVAPPIFTPKSSRVTCVSFSTVSQGRLSACEITKETSCDASIDQLAGDWANESTKQLMISIGQTLGSVGPGSGEIYYDE
jgi:hypothetical protein